MSDPTSSAAVPSSQLDVSVVVPVYNEEGNVALLIDELVAAFATIPAVTWEVILVDDGSRDGSGAVLAEQARARPEHVRVVVLRRNYGQTAALDCGFRLARGQVIVPMDADRQNDPRDIPRLLGGIAEGADVVSGWRRDRKDPLISRKVPSAIANWLIARATGLALHDVGCTLKAYRREVLEDVRLFGEMHRFIPAHALWRGAKITELVVSHRARTWGSSKYGIVRTLKVVLDLMTVIFIQGRYSSKPLHVFGAGGLLLGAVSFGLAIWAVVQKLSFPVDDPRHVFIHRNPLALLAALTLVLGAGAVALGLIAEILVRIYYATGGSAYAMAGLRNVPGQPTPEEARALSPALVGLATRPAS